jgi:uncharacterized membrane protein
MTCAWCSLTPDRRTGRKTFTLGSGPFAAFLKRLAVPMFPSRIALRLLVLLLLAAMFDTASVPASADFRICNRTTNRIGIAMGYKEEAAWITEGWWNIAANSCETVIRGALVARYYYLYGVDYDQGGQWAGKAFMCTRDKEFTIRGVDDCLARGFDRTGFFEVDTGEQKNWTVQLTEQGQAAPTLPQPTIGNRPGAQAR